MPAAVVPEDGPRVVWINGAFGVGKTSVGEELVRHLPGSLLFDPEALGAFLRDMVPRGEQTDDFQDLAAWRHLTREAVLALADARRRAGALVMPMTIWRADYFAEIVDGIRDAGAAVVRVTLVAPASMVVGRLRARSSDEAWALERVDRCVAALTAPRFATHFDAGDRDAATIAAELAETILDAPPPKRS